MLIVSDYSENDNNMFLYEKAHRHLKNNYILLKQNIVKLEGTVIY